MRNLFDQYSQPENRLTHALLVSLDADRRLLRSFIRWAGICSSTRSRLTVLEQTLPGELDTSLDLDEGERRGLPDGWIHDGLGWAVLIESKVAATPDHGQVRRHLRMASVRGFPKARLLWITVKPVVHRFRDRVISRTWSELYEWLRREARISQWAQRLSDYLEVAEVRADMKEYLKEGTLTRFSGIPFDSEHPYSYSQARRILGLLRERLVSRRDLAVCLGADSKHQGRGAIKGKRESAVWDFVALKDLKGSTSFTQYPHLTLGISSVQLEAYITIPNNVRRGLRTQMLGPSYDHFEKVVKRCTESMENSLRGVRGVRLFLTIVQRRYPSMSAAPIHDLRMSFDPRTAFKKKGLSSRRRPKFQPEWLKATYEALKHRRSNLQFQIGAAFPYDKCELVRRSGIENAVAKTWIACRPVVEAGRT